MRLSHLLSCSMRDCFSYEEELPENPGSRESLVEPWLQGRAGTDDGPKEQGAETGCYYQRDGNILRQCRTEVKDSSRKCQNSALLSWASYLNLLVSQIFIFKMGDDNSIYLRRL